MLSLISSHSMLLPWGRGCTSRGSQGQDKPQCAWSHNPPTWAQTAGKLLTINRHRCVIIVGCLFRYQDRFKNTGDPLWRVDNVPRIPALLSNMHVVWEQDDKQFEHTHYRTSAEQVQDLRLPKQIKPMIITYCNCPKWWAKRECDNVPPCWLRWLRTPGSVWLLY